MDFKNKNLKYLYIIIIFYIIWLVLIPIGFKFLVNPILTGIKAGTGMNIELTNPKLRTSIIPKIKIKADSISVLNSDNSKALNLTKPKLTIRILPLLTGKIHLNSFEGENLDCNLFVRDKLYLGEYVILLPKGNLKAKIDRIKLNNLNTVVNENGNIHKITGQKIYFKKTRKFFKVNSNLKILSDNNCANIDLNINLPKYKNNYKKTRFDINIQNLNLSSFSKIAAQLTENDIISANGIVNINSDNKKLIAALNNVEINYSNKNKSIIFPKNLTLGSNHKILNNAVEIISFNLKSDGILSSGSGKIKDILSLRPYFDINIDIDKTDIRKGVLAAPPIVTPDINIPKLKEYPFYGNITGSMQVKGALPEPEIFGKLKVKDGVLIKPIPNTTEGANIDIEFVGKKLLLDVYVPAGNNEIVEVDGDITIYGEKYAHLNVKSTSSVDLQTAEFVLNPLHEILCFMIGPVPIMEVTGKGNIDIKIEGTKKNPHIWGDFNFENANAQFIEVKNLVLEKASGNLNFDNQKAHFINNTGVLHGQSATVEGTCTLYGELDFNVTANNQNLSDLIITLTTSPLLEDIKNLVPPISDVKGKSDFYLNLKGKLYDIKDLKLNENVIPSGCIKLLGNSVKISGFDIDKIKGIINYNKTDCDFDLISFVSGYKTLVKGGIKNNIADVDINAPRFCVNNIDRKTFNFLDELFIKLKAHYKGDINDIEIGGIDALIDIIPDNKTARNLKIYTGKISLKNSNLNISNFKGVVKKTPLSINLNIKNIGKKKLELSKASANGNLYCNNFDISMLNYLKKLNILPTDIQREIDKVNFVSGKAGIIAKIKNNKMDTNVDMDNIDIEYSAYKNTKNENVNIPLKLINGNIKIKNDTLNLNKMNCLIDDMPVLVYGQASGIYKKPQYNIHVNSKLSQKVFDKYWNSYNIYPVKVNGDITLTSAIAGNSTETRIQSDIRLEEQSNIYYMGATIGDSQNPNTLDIDANIDKTGKIKLNKFNYNKIITSQNNKQNTLPLLLVNGQMKKSGEIIEFKNLSVKTENPVNANLFNIIFKKPTIKNGNFTSDLKINGTTKRPKIAGTFDVKNLDMPYLNTTIKGLNIDFKPADIQITAKGEVLDNYMMMSANMKNSFTPPYKINNADIYINDFDINHSVNLLKQIELKGISSAISPDTDATSNDIINSLLFNDVKIRAGNVKIKNIKASNLESVCSLNDKMQVAVESFKFNMANGVITGKVGYNLLNNYMNMELNSKDVNANSLVTALFDLPNQIHGSLTGHIELNCNATNDKTRLETLNGTGTFNVANGRMPKLGSLEYLLRAGNLIKGGITGLSMNGIIDIITPMKTGEFSDISGRIGIKDGVAKTVEIHTNGKNLSLYMIGGINLSTGVADMRVFGQLSRKVSTILGAAGNISLNTLFNKIPGISLNSNSSFINDLNKIPGIELSNKSTRKFMVEILGDINGEDFVRSFKWIN